MKQNYYVDFEDRLQRVKLRKIADTRHSMFFVQFEDGYENVFFTDIETGEWMEQDLGPTHLAASLGELISTHYQNTFPNYSTQLTWFEPAGRLRFRFGYVKRNNGNKVIYDIYHSNKRFMFTLIKDEEEGWEIPFNYNYNGWHFKINYFNDIAFIIELNQL